MPEFDLNQLLQAKPSEIPDVTAMIVRMTIATVLGGFIAGRIWRVLLPSVPPPSPQNAQAQTLMAAAGSVMVVVLGDSPARAFGLVGLGAFIRFRSGIADPRDAVVTFVMIGVGMACGLGLIPMALVATVLVSGILFGFDLTEGRLRRRMLVIINAEDPLRIKGQVEALFPNSRIVELSSNAIELGKESGRLVLEVSLRGSEDVSFLRELLAKHEVPGIRRVAFATD